MTSTRRTSSPATCRRLVEDAAFGELLNPDRRLWRYDRGDPREPARRRAGSRVGHRSFPRTPCSKAIGQSGRVRAIHRTACSPISRCDSNAPVSVIDWGSDPIRVESRHGFDRGSSRAGDRLDRRAAVGPDSFRAGFAGIDSRPQSRNLPMASQNKVAFGVDPKLLDLEPDSMQYTRHRRAIGGVPRNAGVAAADDRISCRAS